MEGEEWFEQVNHTLFQGELRFLPLYPEIVPHRLQERKRESNREKLQADMEVL